MSTAASSAPTKLTAADLLAISDEKNYELIDGQLKELDIGFDSSWVAMALGAFLFSYCRQHNLGWVLGSDAGFQCFSKDSEKVRKPDVAFISLEKISAEHRPTGFIRVPPDLAVEVVSLHDLADEINQKVAEYLAAGVRLVWVIYPTTGQVLVYNTTGGKILSSADELSGEDVIPGFRLKISELLRKPGE
jgi:Uma2 family endonuclease